MLSTYWKNLIMDNVWKTAATTNALPEHFYIGYSTTAPAADGSNISEPNANTGYTRIALDGALGAAADGVTSNTVQIGMPESTADQGTATHYVIFDAQSGGNFLAGGKLTNSRVMQIESTLLFKVGAIKIGLEDKVEAAS